MERSQQEKQAYHEYRMMLTTPSYGLEKVQKMIGAMPDRSEDEPRRPAAIS